MCVRDQSRRLLEYFHGANTIGEVEHYIQTWLHFDNDEMLDVRPYLERLENKNKAFYVEATRNPDLRIIVWPYQIASWSFLQHVKWILN